MKEKALHIGVVVLGFIVMIQGVSAQTLPETDHVSRLVQIDAEEISHGEDSKIRFSDTERVLPAIEAAPSQQSMSSSLTSADELSLEDQMVQQMNEQRMEERRERMRRNQERQDERRYQDQNERDQNDQRNQNNQNRDRNQNNQEGQNQDRQNQGGQNQNGQGTCPNPNDERCFYPESQRERCEMWGGEYSDGQCYMKEMSREECEEMGGYYRDGRCEMNGWNEERQQCEEQGGVYRNGQCSMGNDGGNQNRSNEYGERQRCEVRGGEYKNGTCIYDNNGQKPYERNNRNSQSSLQGEEDDVMVSLKTLARTEKRKTCEKEGGKYLGEGMCSFNYDQRTCEHQEGVFRDNECIINTDDL